MKIAIVGKEADTLNYVRYVQSVGAMPLVTLNPETAAACDALLLPGGGDVTPAFFGETNHGSRNIDTELDILQLQSLDMAVRARQPVLGICKGFQIINVKFGGTLIQDLDPERTALHGWEEGDRYHPSAIPRGSWLRGLYGETTVVNSAHHQALERLGEDLEISQRCPLDNCVEALAHRTLPILGVQWHPERIDEKRSGTNGGEVLAYFAALAQG